MRRRHDDEEGWLIRLHDVSKIVVGELTTKLLWYLWWVGVVVVRPAGRGGPQAEAGQRRGEGVEAPAAEARGLHDQGQ